MRRWIWICGIVALGAGCPSPNPASQDGGQDAGDPRCSVQNCQTMIDSRRLEPAAMPSSYAVVHCYDAGQPPADGGIGALGIQACPAACNAEALGGVLQCLSQHPECSGLSDGGQTEAWAACTPASDGGAQDAGCLAACDSARQSCESSCFSAGSYASCFDCAASCGLTWAACENGC